jgi:antitoxin YefM
VSKAKNRLLRLIHELEEHQQAIALTRDGVPAAVLLSMEHFRGLLETIEILADPKALRSLRRSLKQAERGEWLSHREVFDRDSS